MGFVVFMLALEDTTPAAAAAPAELMRYRSQD